MRIVQKTVALLLVLCTVALTGCAGADTQWVYEDGGYRIPAGLYILYQMDALESARQKLQEEHQGDAGFSLPAQKELMKLTLEGKTVSDWINEKARESCRKWFAIAQQCEARGLVLSDADKSTIDRNADSIWAQSQQQIEPNGIAISSVRDYYANEVRKTYLFENIYAEGGELAPGDDALKEIFAKDYAKIETLALTRPATVPEGETKTLEQLSADVKTQAEGYLKRLEEGAAIEDLAYEYGLSQAQTEEEKAAITKPEKSQMQMIVTEDYRASYGDALVDGAFAAGTGKTALVEADGYYAVIRRLDIMADPVDFENYSYTILLALKSEEFEGKLTEWAAAAQPGANQAALNRYQPAKLKEAAAK